MTRIKTLLVGGALLLGLNGITGCTTSQDTSQETTVEEVKEPETVEAVVIKEYGCFSKDHPSCLTGNPVDVYVIDFQIGSEIYTSYIGCGCNISPSVAAARIEENTTLTIKTKALKDFNESNIGDLGLCDITIPKKYVE